MNSNLRKVRLSQSEGVTLHRISSVLESYCEKAAIMFYNPAKQLAREIRFDSLQKLAGKVDEKFDAIMEPLGVARHRAGFSHVMGLEIVASKAIRQMTV